MHHGTFEGAPCTCTCYVYILPLAAKLFHCRSFGVDFWICRATAVTDISVHFGKLSGSQGAGDRCEQRHKRKQSGGAPCLPSLTLMVPFHVPLFQASIVSSVSVYCFVLVLCRFSRNLQPGRCKFLLWAEHWASMAGEKMNTRMIFKDLQHHSPHCSVVAGALEASFSLDSRARLAALAR